MGPGQPLRSTYEMPLSKLPQVHALRPSSGLGRRKQGERNTSLFAVQVSGVWLAFHAAGIRQTLRLWKHPLRFDQQGRMFDGKRWAAVKLPEYAITEICTGQYARVDDDFEQLRAGEISLAQ